MNDEPIYETVTVDIHNDGMTIHKTWQVTFEIDEFYSPKTFDQPSHSEADVIDHDIPTDMPKELVDICRDYAFQQYLNR